MDTATISGSLSSAQPIIVNLNSQANATDYAAWSGLMLSLALGGFEIWKYWNNRPKLKITTRYNQEIMAYNGYGRLTNQSTGKTFWSVDVANVGSRDLIITRISFAQKHTSKMSMLTKDYNGIIRKYTLIPGDSYSYTIADELLDSKNVTMVEISDATGKIYYKKLKHKQS